MAVGKNHLLFYPVPPNCPPSPPPEPEHPVRQALWYDTAWALAWQPSFSRFQLLVTTIQPPVQHRKCFYLRFEHRLLRREHFRLGESPTCDRSEGRPLGLSGAMKEK